MTVRRFDRALFGKAVITDAGFLKAPATLTRTGVFEYLQGDGKIVRELRLPEEVFNADSMASFELVPVTDDHPNGLVTAENAKALQIGSVSSPSRDGEFLKATLMVTDAAVIDKVSSGKQELSCGYYCDRELAPPGAKYFDTVANREIPYDYIQRNIRGNHVAIVTRGRAGPEVRLNLDSTDAVSVEGKPKMAKLTIDGADFEVEETVAKALEKQRLATESEIAELKGTVEKTTARADSAEAALTAANEKLKAETSAERIAEIVKARVALEKTAELFSVKADGLSDKEIKIAVVKSTSASINLDGKSDEYVQAAFDFAVTQQPTRNVIAETVTQESSTQARNDSADKSPLELAFAQVKARMQGAK